MNRLYFLTILIALCSCADKFETKIDLSGEWQFRIDSLDIGEKERWFSQDFEDQVILPGSMAENGKGNEISIHTKWTGGVQDTAWYKDPNYAPFYDPDNIRFPFWLQPVKKYTGAAWYRKTVAIPSNWKSGNVFLFLERPHWQSAVWINGQKVGMENSLATPHQFNISSFLKAGKNEIAVCIDNRTDKIDVGENSHSISDHTQTNWNGIVGDMSLRYAAPVYLKNVKLFPDRKTNSIQIKAVVVNSKQEDTDVEIDANSYLKGKQAHVGRSHFSFSVPKGETVLSMTMQMEVDVRLWDEFNPNVYQIKLDLKCEDGVDTQLVDFGFRDFTADSAGLKINDRPVFLRGTLECAIFPLTGYPPTGKMEWEKVFKTVKKFGLNHVRFHSWCPPEVAFVVADEMGVYLQLECSSWANQSTEIGSGFPVDDYVYEESDRIVDTYGNHPSFVMMAYGNEPGGMKHVDYLRGFVTYWKAKDDRRLYTSGSGWPLIEENDYHVTHNGVRIQGWGEGLNSIINSKPPTTDYDWTRGIQGLKSPMVSHEIGQWCAYPNFNEIEKYTGVLKPKNFELFKESLAAHNMEQLADSFLLASGKLQALCYKADIEAALRTPTFGGFQLLDLHDFPGQGTALVGVLDAFWDEKGYITAEEYKHFCNSVVPLARLDKRVFREGETLLADIEIANFGATSLIDVVPLWRIYEGNTMVVQGDLGKQDILQGNGIKLGAVVYELKTEERPRKLTLEVTVGAYQNSWDLWVYPSYPEFKDKDVLVVEKLDNSSIQFLEEGGKVLLSLGKGKVATGRGGEVGVGFSSIFWNTAWTGGQKPHTLGILCDPKHSALDLFPTEYHSNWQWWDAMSHSDAILLESFGSEIKPIVRIIDDWVTNKSLALLFEAKVGSGRILVSGTDLVNGLESRPEAVQLKHSLLNYMSGNEFYPKAEIKFDELEALLKTE
ncbi:sugar-binding domain-containing protein [Mangrovibacterium lignilyticum]|uniref:sugar-binding domain-containing protein n=1 Tax=Mangrovibacterium lignilyticum TaxID=2668052 RepID=UPI0013D4777D|nr:sugar-binding domain-containing protein [Mangrovibacterium lignilyticum]